MDVTENIQDHCEMLDDFKGVCTEGFSTSFWADTFQDDRFFLNKKGQRQKRKKAILCTKDQQDAAEELTRQLNTEEANTTVTVCEDLVQFTEDGSQLHDYRSFYILVGSAMASIMMNKGRLHDSVYDFFQVVEEQGKDVFVLSKLQPDEDNDLFFEFFYQLPKKCRKLYKEIEIKRLSREEIEQADVDGATRTDNSTPRPEQSPQDFLRDPDDVTSSDTKDEEDVLQNIQIGSNLKMKIHTDSNRQLIFAKQEGPRNNMQINIVSKNKRSHVKLVLKSKPTDEEFEEELFSEVKDEVLQINMETTGASNFVVKKGSVIIEMDVESGESMDFDWICCVLRLIFKDKLAKALPDGISLEVEVERNIVISANKFEFMRNETLHSACVSKEKYDELQKQYEDTKQTLEETLKNENLHCCCVPMNKHEALLQDYQANKRELEALRTSAVENQFLQSQLMSKAETEEWNLEASVTSSTVSTPPDHNQSMELLVPLVDPKKEHEVLERVTGKSSGNIQRQENRMKLLQELAKMIEKKRMKLIEEKRMKLIEEKRMKLIEEKRMKLEVPEASVKDEKAKHAVLTAEVETQVSTDDTECD